MTRPAPPPLGPRPDRLEDDEPRPRARRPLEERPAAIAALAVQRDPRLEALLRELLVPRLAVRDVAHDLRVERHSPERLAVRLRPRLEGQARGLDRLHRPGR